MRRLTSDLSLRDKVVFITGGAGGIGAASAAELARRGARCVLADVDAAGLQRTPRASQRRARRRRRARGTRTDGARADGSEHEVDTIIFGTGFEVLPPPATERIHGRDGSTLADVWRQRLRHYRAVEVAGFPNYFRLGGVGCATGHGSHIYMIESQMRWVRDALRAMARTGARTVEVSQQAQDDYMRFATTDTARTVWALGGCQSWYLDQHGEATTMWPRSLRSYGRLMANFNPADHTIRTADQLTPQTPAPVT